jgi:hypothetical protein
MANLFDINHVLGKIITLVLVIVAANFHILAGVLVLLFIISMNHYVVEGMENNDSSKESQNSSSEKTQEKTQEESPISLFKTDKCSPLVVYIVLVIVTGVTLFNTNGLIVKSNLTFFISSKV